MVLSSRVHKTHKQPFEIKTNEKKKKTNITIDLMYDTEGTKIRFDNYIFGINLLLAVQEKAVNHV